MKPYILVIVLLLFCFSASAQIPQTHKIVYLKDGSSVRGTLTVNDSAGYIMVVDNYKETHYYRKDMVAKIDDEAPQSHSYTLKPKGYICNIEIGGAEIFGQQGAPNAAAVSFNVINSYLICPYTSIGMGIGTELTAISTETFSLYADSRSYFMRSDISPFFDLALGYSAVFGAGFDNYYFQPGLNLNHAMMFNPSFGIRVPVSKKVSFTANVGYKLFYFGSNPGELNNAFTFRTGFQF